MRIATVAMALVIAACPVVSTAQESLVADEQIIIKQIQTDRRAVYADNLKLTDSESRAFWPIYDEYEASMKKITDQRLAMLDNYAAKYDTLTDADAAQMIASRMKLDKETLALKQKYARKIQKALPGVKALRYMQLQDRVDNVIAGEAYSIIPLAR
jgi:hypothetical protein